MSSIGNRWVIEKYICGGYGCPDLGLMGYTTIEELLFDIGEKIRELEE